MTIPNPKTTAKSKSIGQRMRYGFGWGAAGTLAWRSLTALSSIIVARILGPASFGEIGIIRSTTNLFTVFAGFRLGAVANKHIAEFRESNPNRAARILKMTVVISGIFCALVATALLFGSGYIARSMLNNPELALPLRISSVFLFFQAYSSVRETVLIGTESFRAFAIVNVAKGALTALLIIPGAYFFGVTGAVSALSLASVISYIILQFYVRQALNKFEIAHNITFREWRAELPIIWTYAVPSVMGGAMIVAMNWYGRMLLTNIDDGYIQLGFFEAANQWRTMILFLPGILSKVAMPILSETHGRDKSGDFHTATIMQFQAILSIMLPLTVGVISLSPLLMMIFGSGYSGSEEILPVLMISVFIFGLNQSLRKVYDGSGRLWQSLWIQALWAFTFATIALASVPGMGAMGLAIAFTAAESAMLLVQLFYIELHLTSGILKQIAISMTLSVLLIGLSIYLPMVASESLHLVASIMLVGGAFAPALLMARKSAMSRFT